MGAQQELGQELPCPVLAQSVGSTETMNSLLSWWSRRWVCIEVHVCTCVYSHAGLGTCAPVSMTDMKTLNARAHIRIVSVGVCTCEIQVHGFTSMRTCALPQENACPHESVRVWGCVCPCEC